jgi:hypothetical protein
VEPAALFCGLGEDLAQRAPESQRPVTGREHRGTHAAAGAVAQQVSPRFGELPVPVGQGDELFAAVGAHADHHQQAQRVLLQPDVHVNAVGPQVDAVRATLVTALECVQTLNVASSVIGVTSPGARDLQSNRSLAQPL